MNEILSLLAKLPTIFVVAVFVATGCDSSSSAPPPPPVSSSDDGEYSGTSKNLSKKSLDDEEELDDEEDTDEEEELKAAFNFGGAEIGEKEVIDAVKKCHESEKFYNRFDEDEALGKCTKLALAKVDCDSKGLKAILSEKQLTQFKTALADDSSTGYKGWEIDQCLDCEKDADEDLCKNSSGTEQVGTKVFFVKEADNEISGKSMVLPVRPGTSSSKE